jgi:hypothetical protein
MGWVYGVELYHTILAIVRYILYLAGLDFDAFFCPTKASGGLPARKWHKEGRAVICG